jgi:hypothetical protein
MWRRVLTQKPRLAAKSSLDSKVMKHFDAIAIYSMP